MHPTRRTWAVGALVAVLAGYAVVVARPLALAGVVPISAWVLARQATFLRTLERSRDALSIDQRPAHTRVRTVDSVPVTLAVTLERPSPLSIAVRAGLPTATTAADSLTVSLPREADEVDDATERDGPSDRGRISAAAETTVSWPVAGRHRFEAATVTAADGWFRETVTAGPTPTVTVEPPELRRVHVGEGGDRVLAAYGEHESRRRGSGIEPAEIREYVPGDTADHIDWKATARLATPHVREYDVETDRWTLLVVDHRGALATGPPEETKLDYLREVALATAASARRLSDPVGLLTVGDDGITTRLDPSSTPETYVTIRRRLLDLEPTGHTGTGNERTRDGSLPDSRPERGFDRPTETVARRAIATLEGDESAFAATLRPFYTDRRRYRTRFDSDPLYGAVRTGLARAHGGALTVVFTDDSSPRELRETVTLARERGDEVLVLLAPTVLYEPGGLADVERAYDRYVAFEDLRRELARMDRVTALEVGPGDRLATVLEAGRATNRRRETKRGVRS